MNKILKVVIFVILILIENLMQNNLEEENTENLV